MGINWTYVTWAAEEHKTKEVYLKKKLKEHSPPTQFNHRKIAFWCGFTWRRESGTRRTRATMTETHDRQTPTQWIFAIELVCVACLFCWYIWFHFPSLLLLPLFPPFVALMKKNPEKIIGFSREGNIKSGNIIKVREWRSRRGAQSVDPLLHWWKLTRGRKRIVCVCPPSCLPSFLLS